MKSTLTWKNHDIFYLKNLYGLFGLVAAITFLSTNSISTTLLISGGFLVFEHIWNWMVFEIKDWKGHEYVGLLLIVCGFLLHAITWLRVVAMVIILAAIIVNNDRNFK